jgi:citrate lyase subunit beta / citryl-CoA lyase
VRSYLTLSAVDLKAGAPAAAPADAFLIELDGDDAGEPSAGARDAVAAWLPAADPARVWVRITPGPVGHELVRDLVLAGLRRVCLARTESVVQLDALDAVLSTVELEAGLPPRAIAVAPVLESAAGVLAAVGVARAARVVGLHLGELALRAELAIDPSPDERELAWIRSQVVLASAAAGIGAPVGSPPADADDVDGLRRTSEALRRAGFGGRACTTLAQISIVNEVF